MNQVFQLLKTLPTHLRKDKLFENSFYLMVSTATLAGSGFFFWIIAARVFTPAEVGIGAAIISVMTIISSFGQLGLGNSLIKYLPKANNQNIEINTSFTLAIVASIILAVLFVVGVKFISPELVIISKNIILATLFVTITVIASLNTLIENVFIANQSSLYVLIKNAILGVTKLFLPLLFISMGAYGIFLAFGLASLAAFIAGIMFLVVKFKYRALMQLHAITIKKMMRFTIGNYLAETISRIPTFILPLFIINTLGAKFSAYYYMDMMIANLLFIIPYAASQSLFAVGAANEADLKTHLIKTIKIVCYMLSPAIVMTIFLGKYILLVFGKQYSAEGIQFLQILSISGIFVAINAIGDVLLRIRHRMRFLVAMNIIYVVLILGTSYLLKSLGLVGIGIAWIVSNSVVSAIYVYTWINLSVSPIHNRLQVDEIAPNHLRE